MAKELIIDCHALLGRGMSWSEPARPVNYEIAELFERGAAAGITRHCIMAPRVDDYAEANRKIADACRNHVGRLTGIAVRNPQKEAGRLRELLTRDVRDLRLRGVRSDGHPTRELLDTARELRIPVIYYPDRGRTQGLGRFFHMPASAYPDVAFILPHLGEYRSLVWQNAYGSARPRSPVSQHPSGHVRPRQLQVPRDGREGAATGPALVRNSRTGTRPSRRTGSTPLTEAEPATACESGGRKCRQTRTLIRVTQTKPEADARSASVPRTLRKLSGSRSDFRRQS